MTQLEFQIEAARYFPAAQHKDPPCEIKADSKEPEKRSELSYCAVCNSRCSQVTGLLMSIYACASIIWTGRQNNHGPNSHEDYDLFRLV